MVSFQHKLAAGLEKRGVGVAYDLEDWPYAAVLVIGGTRRLAGLWRARRRGARIVQRLDGMNWLHRVHTRDGRRLSSGLRHAFRSEYGNWLLALVRSRLAQRVVYQSEFSRRWWERVHRPTRPSHAVIFNGVDLDAYTPDGSHERPAGFCRLLLVEGSLMGGYEQGLQAAVSLAALLAQHGSGITSEPRRVELMVVGRVASKVQAGWQQRAAALGAGEALSIRWAGLLPRERIPETDRSAHLLYSSDVNAACPNSVIEALACGLPVVSFDTGALPELVTGDSGRIAPYGGDPWRLDPPDVPALAQMAEEVLRDQARFRQAARQRAEAAFGLDTMVDAYLAELLG
jgi:glycosyltransferase involved in cell wall biosynthesis